MGRVGASAAARPFHGPHVEPVRGAAWLDALYRVHCDRVYRYALALLGDVATAEDVCAEVFLRAWRSRDTLRDDGHALAWLFAIARACACEAIRRAARHRQFESVLADSVEPEPPSADGPSPTHDRTWAAFRRLTAEQQRVLWLRFVEGYSPGEVARHLGLTPGAVRAAQFRGLARMRRLLEGSHGR